MATSGRPIEVTFTPADGGLVKVRVTFNMWWNGSDFGASAYARVFCEQSSVVSYGLSHNPIKRQAQDITAEGTFAVTGGSEVKVGLHGGITGASTVDFSNLIAVADFTAV